MTVETEHTRIVDVYDSILDAEELCSLIMVAVAECGDDLTNSEMATSMRILNEIISKQRRLLKDIIESWRPAQCKPA